MHGQQILYEDVKNILNFFFVQILPHYMFMHND